MNGMTTMPQGQMAALQGKATLVEIRTDSKRFPRLYTYPRDEAISLMSGILLMAYQYRGQQADTYSLMHMSSALIDILLEDETYHLTHSLEVADLDGNERQKYSQIDLNEVREFIKQIQVTDGLMYVMDSSAGDEIRVYETISGDKIATLVVPEEFVKKGQRVISCTCEGKVLLYSLINEENRECIFYCDISTIGTPDFQWYEVEKVN